MQNIPFFYVFRIAVGTVCDKDEIKKSFVFVFFAGLLLIHLVYVFSP